MRASQLSSLLLAVFFMVSCGDSVSSSSLSADEEKQSNSQEEDSSDSKLSSHRQEKGSSSSTASSSSKKAQSSSSTKSSSSQEKKSSDSEASSSSKERASSSSTKSSSSQNEPLSSSELSSSSLAPDSSKFKPKISYQVDGAAVEKNNGCVEIDNSIVTISCGGTYEFSGTNDDGQIVVNTLAEDSTVHIKLNNLHLKSSTDAPFFVINSSKTIIKNLEGSINTFEDASTRAPISYQKKGKDAIKIDTTGACIYAKDDLTINGKGSLFVIANYKNGIQSTNDLRIRDTPTIEVQAPNNALKGKGSVDIEGGTITLDATEGSGIKSDEGADEQQIVSGKGSIRIKGGVISIHSGDDGISAYNEIIMSDDVSIPVVDIRTNAKGLKATHIKMGNAISSVYSGSDGWKVQDRLEVSNGYHYMNVSSDGIDVKNNFTLTGGVIIIENLSVKDSASIIAFDSPINAEGGILLGFGKGSRGGFVHDIHFSKKKYYGTESVAYKPSFNGTVIVVNQDSLDIDERDISNWEPICFSNETDNCFYHKK